MSERRKARLTNIPKEEGGMEAKALEIACKTNYFLLVSREAPSVRESSFLVRINVARYCKECSSLNYKK